MYRALIVEDHPQIALFLSSFLDLYDIQADYCADGNAGLLRAVADDYDFVLLDLRLPEADSPHPLLGRQLSGVSSPRRCRAEYICPV